MFGAVLAAEGTDPDVVVAIAQAFSPRLEVPAQVPASDVGSSAGALAKADREVVLDLRGLERLFGDAREVAAELRRDAADRGVRVRVAIAGTRTAARLLARHRAGITVIEPGSEAAALAPLPLALLEQIADAHGVLQPDPHAPDAPPTLTLRRWGLRTLGDLAALPPDDLAARLGQAGVRWQALARGEDPRPLVPAVPDERFEQSLVLEWPIEGLEPLSFVLGRLLEPLSVHLERRDRGAAVIHVRLHLVDRTVHERSLQLPAPMRDPRTLRTLVLLDLESHPPAAAIDRVTVAVDPTPGRVVQFSLLTRPLPSPERVSTLVARLTALLGEGRCGAPALVDTWQPGAFAIVPFAPSASHDIHAGVAAAAHVVVALRRFRIPIPARVAIEEGRPVRVDTDRRGVTGGRVETCAGPWRTSGAWWDGALHWDRDEWDVALSGGATWRVFRERDTDRWFVEGVLD